MWISDITDIYHILNQQGSKWTYQQLTPGGRGARAT